MVQSIGDILDNLMKLLPVPQTTFEITWFLIGWMAGYAFGARCDEDLLESIEKQYAPNGWAKIKKLAFKTLVKALNFIHHAWIGLLGVVYFGVPIVLSIQLPLYIPVFPCAELFWLFLGLALEDLQYHLRASATDGNLCRFVKVKKKTP